MDKSNENQAITNTEYHSSASAMDLAGILFIVFRHKWKILIFSIFGLIGAILVYIYRPVIFESEAKLLVRYVLDRSAIDSVESQDGTSGTRQNDGVISSEIEILTSWDLALETAEAIGIERLVPQDERPSRKEDAARVISKSLAVAARKGSNVIVLSFQNADPQLATDVLQEIVSRYFAKHLEVHRSSDAFAFVSQQSEQVRARLRQTEEQLAQIKSQGGIISLGESRTSLTAQLAKVHSELLSAETERAEQIARVKELERWVGNKGGGKSESISTQKQPLADSSPGQMSRDSQTDDAHSLDPDSSRPAIPTSSDIQRYQALIDRVGVLRQAELELLSKYTAENELVKVNQAQIQSLDDQRRELERRFQSLTVAVRQKEGGTQNQQHDIVSERARLAAIEAKLATLRSQVADAQSEFIKFSNLGVKIEQLERKKEVEETNYKYFEASVEKARVDEALDPSKMPNISIVQKPSAATRVAGKSKKIVLSLAGSGVVVGLCAAFFIEMLLDRTVKRSSELETGLGIPLLRSIPLVNLESVSPTVLNGGNKVLLTDSRPSKDSLKRNPPPWETGHFIRPYCDAIRDRMVLYFELNRLTHKPKLIAVTACASGAGTSTIAAGLAASLSETGAGKVLLVDMNVQCAEMHPFFGGKSAYSLSDALDPSTQITSTAENLYLATGNPNLVKESANTLPRRFHELFPSLKASDFDYIIFDMPPLDKSMSALSMAGFMDKVILVIEAEKADRGVVMRARADLADAKANLTGVFNKAQSYMPAWLGLDT